MHIHRGLRHRHSGAELAAAMGGSLRTVYLDIERLRKAGYPIEGVSGPGGAVGRVARGPLHKAGATASPGGVHKMS